MAVPDSMVDVLVDRVVDGTVNGMVSWAVSRPVDGLATYVESANDDHVQTTTCEIKIREKVDESTKKKMATSMVGILEIVSMLLSCRRSEN